MTNQDYLLSQLGFAPGNNNTLLGAMIDQGIISTDPYVIGNMNPLKIAAVTIIKILLSTADTDQQSGEIRNQVKYDRVAILARLKMLETELGLTDAVPTVTGRSPW